MIAFPAGTKVWIAGGVTDMRRRQRFLEPVAQPLATMNTLALAVQQGLGRDPHGGEIFCFRGRKGDRVSLCTSFVRTRVGSWIYLELYQELALGGVR
mgnify:CR=1 FL=1